MEVDSVPLALPQQQVLTAATILCCNCGVPIDGTVSAGALCYDCIRLTVDASEGIQREAVLHSCRDCERWLSPPAQWVPATLESRELLALCLRKLRGLNKVRIIDASFLWTEPHSKRIKVKLTVQQEAPSAAGTIIQQTFEVEYVVHSQQCPDCAKSYTANVWRASVQVRQKVPHKRTFLYLEQLMLKHGAHKDAINVKEVHDGLDFYFSQKNHAEKFVDFLNSVTPVRIKKSQELISMDIHTSKKSYKFTYSAELVPICRDDLVALPIKMAKQIGNISPLAICARIGTAINLLDPHTLQTADIPSPIYWRAPFTNLADTKDLVEFVVLDIEPLSQSNGRYFLAEATVARMSDLGVNDKQYVVRTHLGAILHPGDSVMGYLLEGTNYNNAQFDEIESSSTYGSQIPDVILVKKHFPRRRKNKDRSWKLKRMDRDQGELLPKKADQERMDADYEMFLRDVEEDPELQQTFALYRAQQKQRQADEMSVATSMDAEDDDAPRVDIRHLIDEMDEMEIKE